MLECVCVLSHYMVENLMSEMRMTEMIENSFECLSGKNKQWSKKCRKILDIL